MKNKIIVGIVSLMVLAGVVTKTRSQSVSITMTNVTSQQVPVAYQTVVNTNQVFKTFIAVIIDMRNKQAIGAYLSTTNGTGAISYEVLFSGTNYTAVANSLSITTNTMQTLAAQFDSTAQQIPYAQMIRSLH
jgi:hypothetical protein